MYWYRLQIKWDCRNPKCLNASFNGRFKTKFGAMEDMSCGICLLHVSGRKRRLGGVLILPSHALNYTLIITAVRTDAVQEIRVEKFIIGILRTSGSERIGAKCIG
jgi:hypothetical protein